MMFFIFKMSSLMSKSYFRIFVGRMNSQVFTIIHGIHMDPHDLVVLLSNPPLHIQRIEIDLVDTVIFAATMDMDVLCCNTISILKFLFFKKPSILPFLLCHSDTVRKY